jgi:pilus assembly protein Flp/PilA
MDYLAVARYLLIRCRVGIESERGASLVEYAFLVGLIAMVCLVAVVFFGQSTSTRYSNVASQIGNTGG